MTKTQVILVAITIVVFVGCSTDSGSPTPVVDVIPPSVSITAPRNNATVTDSVLVTASATDNVGVEKVEFYVDGFLTTTRSTVPWQYLWDVQGLAPQSVHTLLAKAYDAANNIGSSPTITVTINPPQRALQFNGTTDYVRLPSSTSLTSFGSQITVEAWVKVSSYGGMIMASGNENEYALAVRVDGKLGVTLKHVNTQPNAEFVGKSTLSLDTWYHVAFTYNDSVESILINGIVDTSVAASGTVSTSQYTENISIGAYSFDNYTQHNTYLNGILDDVRIWNVGRTATQIQNGMNSELSGSESGLVGYWKFNDNVTDSSPSGNNGTVYGSPAFVTVRH